jgi:DNA helicase-2/ATP-dependent DNA helicase PcrA
MAKTLEAPTAVTETVGEASDETHGGLDPDQHAAVRASLERPLLVVAGPGAGKTRVITQRVVQKIRSGEVGAGQVLAITFTNAAASEMASRVAADLGSAGQGVRISTIHAFAAQVVRRHPEKVGLDGRFSILDDDEQLAIARGAVEKGELEIDPRELLRRIAAAKANLEDAALWQIRGEPELARAFDLYEEELLAANALDFEGLLRSAVIVLSDDRAAVVWRAGLQALFVDEFHDVSEAQFALIRLLVPGGAGLTAVADDDQVIYTFRGADPEFTVDFERFFPGAQAVVLRSNYRSHSGIVETALRLIGHNEHRRAKDLIAAHGPGPDPVYEAYDSEEAEAEAIAAWAQSHLDAGERAGELGVLFRMRGLRVRTDLEIALASRGIPYVTLGERALFERSEVRDSLAWLALTVNPSNSAAFSRALQSRPGLGPATARALAKSAKDRRESYEAICLTPWEAGISGKRADAVLAFAESMARIRNAASLSPEFKDLVGQIIVISEIPERLRRRGRAGERQLEGVRELVRVARSYQQLCLEEGTAPRLARFLEELALHAGEKSRPTDAVALATVHAVKGLEFRHVWIAGLEEGVLPSIRSLQEGGIEEERRLAYVALTRARESLVLSGSALRWGRDAVPSRFLGEAGL